jgi:Domain of unknown function (DUF4878)
VTEVAVVVLSRLKGIMMRKTVVIVCAFSLLLSAAVLAGCGSGGGSSTSPVGVTKAFLAAAIKNDVNTTWGMLSRNTQVSMKNKATFAETLKTFGPNDKVVIGKATVTGDKAEVRVDYKHGGGETTDKVTIVLVKDGGAWKIDLTQLK